MVAKRPAVGWSVSEQVSRRGGRAVPVHPCAHVIFQGAAASPAQEAPTSGGRGGVGVFQLQQKLDPSWCVCYCSDGNSTAETRVWCTIVRSSPPRSQRWPCPCPFPFGLVGVHGVWTVKSGILCVGIHCFPAVSKAGLQLPMLPAQKFIRIAVQAASSS